MKNKIKVIIAEDDFLVIEEIKRMLNKDDYQIVGEANNGSEAVKMVCKLKPDLILMDIKMPDMNGIEASRQITNIYPIPIIILSAYESKDLLEEAKNAGVASYIIKPPETSKIERAITIAKARFDDMMRLRDINNILNLRNDQLQIAINKIKLLSSLIPICARCKKIRNASGEWEEIDIFFKENSEAEFTHSICPDCVKKEYTKK